jgi:elongation factor P
LSVASLCGSELRIGMTIRLEGELYRVLAAGYHGGGGKMGGVTHAKLRSLRTGTLREWRFRAEQDVEQVELERQDLQFLYRDGDISFSMNPRSFEQVALDDARLGPAATFMDEGMLLPVEFLGDQAVGVVLPDVVDATVAETAPPFHAQGTDNVWKSARLDNGVSVMVPPFIAPGERIRVDVQAGRYVERAKAGRAR